MNQDIQPLKSIWFRPKDTIRAVLELPSRWPLIWALLFGVVTTQDYMSNRNWGDTMPLFFIFVTGVFLGPLIGWIGWYVASGIFYRTARLLGGEGDWQDTKTAVAWCGIPYVMKGVLWLPHLLIYGREMFTSATPVMDNSPLLILFYLLLALLEFVLLIWFYVVLSHGLGEVHHFSAWKGFTSVILVPLLLFLILLIISGIIYG